MINLRKVAIIGGVRTPFVKAGGVFKNISAEDLGAAVVKGVLKKYNLHPAHIYELIMGNAGQQPDKINIARLIGLKAGLPNFVPAYTVQRVCGSGLQAIADAYLKIAAGEAEIIIAGGTESMSNFYPLYGGKFNETASELFKAKTFNEKKHGARALRKLKLEHFKPTAGVKAVLTDSFIGMHMGETAELLAEKFRIGRNAQDEFALKSHEKAEAAIKSGRLAQEIIPVYADDKHGWIKEDVGPRFGLAMEKLSALAPAFKNNGTVTAGNASQITDGAVALLLMSVSAAQEHGYPTDVFIDSYAFAGCEPKYMGLGPFYAIKKLWPLFVSDNFYNLKLIEINEAFAVQVLACMFMLEKKMSRRRGAVNEDIINVNGGAIALGHPIGATGARLALTLTNELRLRDLRGPALAALCISGGQGGAMVLERI